MKQRILIRDALYKLVNNRTAAGQNVTLTRIRPNIREDIPSIAIYTSNTSIETLDEAPRRYKAETIGTFEIFVPGSYDNDEIAARTADQISQQIIDLIAADDSLGIVPNSHDFVVSDSMLQEIQSDYQDNGDRPILMQKLSYVFEHYLHVGKVPITDFNSAKVDYFIDEHPDADATDIINPN